MKARLRYAVSFLALCICMLFSTTTAFAFDKGTGNENTSVSGVGQPHWTDVSYNIILIKDSSAASSYEKFTHLVGGDRVVKDDYFKALSNAVVKPGQGAIGVHVSTNDNNYSNYGKVRHVSLTDAASTFHTRIGGLGSVTVGGKTYNLKGANLDGFDIYRVDSMAGVKDKWNNYLSPAMQTSTGRAAVLNWFQDMSGLKPSDYGFSSTATDWWVIIVPSIEWKDDDKGGIRYTSMGMVTFDKVSRTESGQASNYQSNYMGSKLAIGQAHNVYAGTEVRGGTLSYMSSQAYSTAINELQGATSSQQVYYKPFTAHFGLDSKTQIYANLKSIPGKTSGTYYVYPYQGLGYAVYGPNQPVVLKKSITMGETALTFFDTEIKADGTVTTTPQSGVYYNIGVGSAHQALSSSNARWIGDTMGHGSKIDVTTDTYFLMGATTCEVIPSQSNINGILAAWRGETRGRMPNYTTTKNGVTNGLGNVLKVTYGIDNLKADSWATVADYADYLLEESKNANSPLAKAIKNDSDLYYVLSYISPEFEKGTVPPCSHKIEDSTYNTVKTLKDSEGNLYYMRYARLINESMDGSFGNIGSS